MVELFAPQERDARLGRRAPRFPSPQVGGEWEGLTYLAPGLLSVEFHPALPLCCSLASRLPGEVSAWHTRRECDSDFPAGQ